MAKREVTKEVSKEYFERKQLEHTESPKFKFFKLNGKYYMRGFTETWKVYQ